MLREFLNMTMANFIGASLNRVSVTGVLCHRYRMTGQEVKSAAQLQRLHDTVVSEYLINNFNVDVSYDKGSSVFFIEIDLTKCMLSPQEAEGLSVAMLTFRQERT